MLKRPPKNIYILCQMSEFEKDNFIDFVVTILYIVNFTVNHTVKKNHEIHHTQHLPCGKQHLNISFKYCLFILSQK